MFRKGSAQRRAGAFLTLVAVGAAALLSACTSTTEQPAPGAGEGPEGKRVLVLAMFSSITFVQTEIDAIVDTLEDAGVEVEVGGVPMPDPQAEFAAIQTAAVQDAYDGYIVIPQDGVTVIPAVEQLVETGKPVVLVSTPLGTDQCADSVPIDGLGGMVLTPACTVGAALGEMGQMACEGVTDCTVAWTTGIPGFASEAEFLRQVVLAMDEIGGTVVESSPTMYDANTTRDIMTNLLMANADIDAVVTQSTNTYLGVIAAAEAAGRDDLKVVASGAMQVQLDALGGMLVATTPSNNIPATEGRLGAELLLDLWSGEKEFGAVVLPLEETGWPAVFTADNRAEWGDYTPEYALN